MMVRFRDLSDPASVEHVDPSNLEDAFGPGARVAAASVEITRDPVSHGELYSKLPWLPEFFGLLRGLGGLPALEPEDNLLAAHLTTKGQFL
jgi:hypothetical protein